MDFINSILIGLTYILMGVMALLLVYGVCVLTWIQVEEERKEGPYAKTAYHTPSER